MANRITFDIEQAELFARVCAELTRQGIAFRASADAYVFAIDITGY